MAASKLNGTTTPLVEGDGSGGHEPYVRVGGSLPSGENHVGAVGGNSTLLSPTVTVSATPDYSSGDSLGGKLTLSSAVRVSGGTAVLQSILIIDRANQKPEGNILIFDSDPTNGTYTDNDAAALGTDTTKLIARIPVTTDDYVTIDSKAVASLTGLGRVLKASGSTSLYAVFVTTTAANMAATDDLAIRFGLLQD